MIDGIGPLVTLSAAVYGSTSIFALTTTRPAFLQVERAGLRGVDDRQAERGALVNGPVI